MDDLEGIDSRRAAALTEAENARFVAERPRSMDSSKRARASMPRGVPMAWMDDLYEHPPAWVPKARAPTSPTSTGTPTSTCTSPT